jgi:NAD(P)-dependent dehydrogenase (short-subunit alcohol dehydrogenase family)
VGYRAHLTPQFGLENVSARRHNLLGEAGGGLALAAARFTGTVALVGIFGVALMQAASQRSCHVVTVVTCLVDQPTTSVPAVHASLIKGALNATTKSLAIECANRVRVNAVSLGIIKTSMHPLEAHQFLASLHPMGRMGEVSDVVDAVMYLDSAGFATGEILHVDGGQVAGHHTILPGCLESNLCCSAG